MGQGFALFANVAPEVLRDDRVDVAEEVGEEVARRERQEDHRDEARRQRRGTRIGSGQPRARL